MRREQGGETVNAKVIFAIVLGIAILGSILFLVSRQVGNGHPAEVSPPAGVLSKNIEIDVFLDGSGSMRHFLDAGGKENTFREFLQNCEFALDSGASQGGWNKPRDIRVWKFGPQPPQRLNPAGQAGMLREAAENPKWFDAPETPIGDAFLWPIPDQRPDTGKLRIVITDLYESDGKLEIPGEAIGRKYLAGEHGAVAIYGVRNAFSGPVSDLPGHPRQALKDAATSMPFYILITGDNAADVRHAQALLSGEQYGQPLRQANSGHRLFASYFARDAGRYEAAPVTYDPRVFRDSSSGLLHFSAVPKANPRSGEDGAAEPVSGRRDNYSAKVRKFEPGHRMGVAAITLGKRSLKDNLLGVSWPKPPATSIQPILETSEAESITPQEWRATAFYCETKKSGEPCTLPPLIDDKASHGVYFCNRNLPAGQADRCEASGDASLAAVLDRSAFRDGRDYLLEFDLVGAASTANFDSGAALMHKWSLAPDEVYDLFKNGKFPTDPSVAPDQHPGKTPNLTLLMNALDGYVLSSDQKTKSSVVRLKIYYLYLSAR